MPDKDGHTSLATRIEQMLTEARVILPGGQALLGFQFIAMLTSAFAELPEGMKLLHAVALCAVALSVLLLMTPAALHRIAYGGEDAGSFLRIGSRLVVGACLPLALGISADIAVVVFKVGGLFAALAVGAAVFALAAGLWLVLPLMLRRRLNASHV